MWITARDADGWARLEEGSDTYFPFMFEDTFDLARHKDYDGRVVLVCLFVF